MKLNFDFELLGLDEKPIEGANAGKLWGWAVSLHKGEILDLDKSDQETLKNFIKDSELFTVLAKAQLLEVINKD
jgi:hypothetical protein